MDTIEIKDDEIDVENIMRQIRENIKKQRDSSAHTKENEVLTYSSTQVSSRTSEHDELQQNLSYLNSNWDVYPDYYISSHRRVIGRFLIWGRRLIHDEVKRYADRIAGKQSQFNAGVIRCIKNLDTKVNETVADTKTAISKDIESKLNDTKATFNKAIDRKFNDTMTDINIDIQNKAWLANLLEKRIKKNTTTLRPLEQTGDVMNYFLFEEKYRGTTNDIKMRQSIFLEYFKNCQNVLDIGCGRGEFLSMLKENSIGVKGIDINEDMVLYCQKNGLNVQEADALSYLQSIKDKSLDGIFSAQVIEHLQSYELINLVKMCHDKMKYGSYFIAETVNPMCLSVFAASFYMDLSHVRPVHPETMKFLLESVGFRDIEFKFLTPFPNEVALNKLQINDEIDDKNRQTFELINKNIDKLNSLLFSYQDYAVICKK